MYNSWIFRLVFSIVLCFCYQIGFCQQTVLDSLETLLPNTTNIDKKIILHQALLVGYKEKDTKKAIKYGDEALRLLPPKAYEQRGEVFTQLGHIHRKSVQFNKAIACFDSAFYYFDKTGIEEKKAAINEHKVFLYKKLVIENLYKAPDKAMEYAQLLLKVVPNDNLNNRGSTYSLIASIYGIKRQTDSAFHFLDSALYFFRKTNNQREIARVYSFKGGTYNNDSNYKEASKWLYKSLEVYDSLNLPAKSANVLDGLAAIDIYLKDYPEALKKIARAIDIYTTVNNDLGLAIAYLNMGVVYIHSQDWKNAIFHLDKAISLFIPLQEYGNLVRTYVLKSNALEKNNQLEQAQQSIQKAVELKEYVHNRVNLLEIYISQAKLFFATKNYSQSSSSFRGILDSAKQISALPLQKDALKGLIKNSVATNNHKKAYEYLTQLNEIKDSLTVLNNQKNIKNLEIKYHTEKKELENQQLLKEKELQAKDIVRNRQLFYLSMGVAFLIFIISILLLRQYKANAAATNNELKSKLLRNQMSPHFLFNSLVAIQSFVYTNHPIKAGDYLSSFATLMRAILDNSSQEYITVAKELQWLENYLSLQLLRFKDKFDYRINIDENIDVKHVLIPPMLIQPFIENSLEHGLKNLDKKGLISIKIQQHKEELYIEVKDNGLGISNTTSLEHKKHQSRALSITKERLKFLNNKQNRKIDFDIKSDHTGTIISFRIPFQSKF
ncbi:tetratricopeptide repeat-containing sensor histidine kinase [Aureispira anguillae]|uniref:Tetratricopeptide repeat protein n=1 Tax=Aureispira anguillae TaxID=2864201 RepID=A0A915YL46_9BACT|nr:tetratricopeptide repeat protein [Aureispira anguillae]BDS15230.1 tetratricopeptide repeat protein [Aureispira anguillae]